MAGVIAYIVDGYRDLMDNKSGRHNYNVFIQQAVAIIFPFFSIANERILQSVTINDCKMHSHLEIFLILLGHAVAL
jgi:hypothetical protein